MQTPFNELTRKETEIGLQLIELEKAKQRLFGVLGDLSERLTTGGVLLPAMPDSTAKMEAEDLVQSELGQRIRNMRFDLHGIASDFEGLRDRLAI